MQIAIGRMNLHAIEARALAAFGAVRVLFDQVRNLADASWARLCARDQLRDVGRRDRIEGTGKARYDLATTMIKLGKHFAAVGVNGIDQTRERRNFVVVVDTELTRCRFAVQADVDVAGDDQWCAALGHRPVKVEVCLIGEAVGRGAHFGGRRFDQATG